MIVIRIEMWPQGDESRKRTLGVGHITNTGAQTLFTGATHGDYDVTLFKSPEYAKSPGVWKKGTVKRFPRSRLGPWDLLLQALVSAIGDRNRYAIRETEGTRA